MDDETTRSERGSVDRGAETVAAPDATSDWAVGARSQERTISGLEPTIMAEGALSLGEAGRLLAEGSFSQRYARRSVIGSGGMGEVRLVEDRRMGRGVAMKVMRAGERGSRDSSRVRFIWEARVQAQLEHPAIVPVYDMGLTPEGTEYFTMKRISGKTLAEILHALRRGSSDASREYPKNLLLGAFRQVCLAVEYAHRRGVLHRDLKPDNVMLGELGEVYVLDWGLAKVAAPEAANAAPSESDASLSRQPQGQSVVGAILGTPGYMSPEQAAGSLELDESTDVYALGAILFEILTLERLHEGEHVMDLLRDTLAGVDAMQKLRDADVPPELAMLCAQATERVRERRLSSARALADGVQLFLDGDRDTEVRARLAEEHALRAEEAAAKALAGEGDVVAHRQRALQEAGRALALDPTLSRAAGTLMSLLLQPPPEVPPEVDAAVASEEREEAKVTARQGVGTYFANGAVAILAGLVLGVRDLGWIVAIVAPQWLAAVLCLVFSRREHVTATHVLTVAALAFAAIAADSGIAGPLILVPGYAAAQVIVLSMAIVYRHRFLLLGMACLSVAIPVALEYTGWVTPAYEFLADGLRIHPRAVELPPLALPLGALAAIITALVGPSIVTWRQAETLTAMRRRVHLQSWMLQQLVPREVSGGRGGAS